MLIPWKVLANADYEVAFFLDTIKKKVLIFVLTAVWASVKIVIQVPSPIQHHGGGVGRQALVHKMGPVTDGKLVNFCFLPPLSLFHPPPPKKKSSQKFPLTWYGKEHCLLLLYSDAMSYHSLFRVSKTDVTLSQNNTER